MSTCWAVLALKPPGAGKTRLASALTVRAREHLVWSMFQHVVFALQQTEEIDRIAVVTARREPMPAGVMTVDDPGRGLNPALHAGVAAAHTAGAREVLILHADLPTLTADEVDRFIRTGRKADLAIAPDTAGTGTNALFLPTATAFSFHFGVDSLRQHLGEASRQQLRAQVINLPGFALDIDEPIDLQQLSAIGRHFKPSALPQRNTLTWTSTPQPSLLSPAAARG